MINPEQHQELIRTLGKLRDEFAAHGKQEAANEFDHMIGLVQHLIGDPEISPCTLSPQ